ncbi:hypothetical protein RT42_GL001268 [Enterococcus cecorum DSM 20682 = ATCC 43198]|nr:hypothetical protein RT42_GL001268 [Enterococcus cecorum DSM 20682 = ATCC 43198]
MAGTLATPVFANLPMMIDCKQSGLVFLIDAKAGLDIL